MGAFEDYINGSFQGLARGARELPENITNWARPAAQEGIKGYDGALTGTDLPYYGDDEISAAKEYFDRKPRSNTSRLVDLVGNYMPGAVASKAAPVAVQAGETVLGAGPVATRSLSGLDPNALAEAKRAYKEGRLKAGDVYVDSGAPKISKGVSMNGEEIYGYDYSPDLFSKSGATGRPIRHYVKLPDGTIIHPDELTAVRVGKDGSVSLPLEEKVGIRGGGIFEKKKNYKTSFDMLDDLMANGVPYDRATKSIKPEAAARPITVYGPEGAEINTTLGDLFTASSKRHDLARQGQGDVTFSMLRDVLGPGGGETVTASANPLAALQQMYREREEY